MCVLCSRIKTITHWHLICSRRAQQYTHENPVKALSDGHNDHEGVEPRTSTTTTTALSHEDNDYRIRGSVTGGFACLEIWHQGQEPSGAIWALPMWAPGQIEGMRVGGVSAEEATEPHSQRKATAVRSKTHSPAKAAVKPRTSKLGLKARRVRSAVRLARMDTEALDGLWAIADALGDLRCDSGWFGGLDLSREREDSRTPFSGDKFSAVREVAETEGFSFREVQRRLRESELKPRATGSGGHGSIETEVTRHWISHGSRATQERHSGGCGKHFAKSLQN